MLLSSCTVLTNLAHVPKREGFVPVLRSRCPPRAIIITARRFGKEGTSRRGRRTRSGYRPRWEAVRHERQPKLPDCGCGERAVCGDKTGYKSRDFPPLTSLDAGC